ncbi:MAG: hypothetical protein BAA01_02795 [Bacillus thermozeamaize]|uniref:Heptaprenyl diphosphate synthase n=1 Tax=Bacillus thermozeamaize TaxID=230954 RepID=A0A1Y3PU80_9BACI|nr:MAG: hypothetical protein BAA01_02795 [Bacillus thermozeamaize]
MGQNMERAQDVLHDVEQQIKEVIRTSDLLQELEYPQVDIQKLELLNWFLKDLGWDEEQRKRVCTATALAQLGLDIHENIGCMNPLDEKKKRNRQLSILAGDFFSSKFYWLLASSGDLSVIPIIAQAVSEINHSKMRLYQTGWNQHHFSQFLQEFTVLQCALYSSFTPLNPQRGQWWKMLIERLIVTEKIFELFAGTERERFLRPEWETLLTSWLHDAERVIRQATTDAAIASRLQERVLHARRQLPGFVMEVQG